MAFDFAGEYPARRMRRMRRDDFSRRLVREHRLAPDDLIYPVFVLDGAKREEPVASLPGISRKSVDLLLRDAERCVEAFDPGVGALPGGRRRAEDRRTAPRRGIRKASCRARCSALKARFPDLGVITDVALDPYTSHGQDGLIDASGYVVNDETVAALVRQALCHAEAGADMVAPSDMMDGRIGAIRQALDGRRRERHADPRVLRPSTRRRSTGRSATPSAPPATSASGNKYTYQMDPANSDEALREVVARSRRKAPTW